MLRHVDIWRAVDKLALSHGMSPSGLARRAGLDATTFNKSKRVTRDGKQRWPSTESISKILRATGASLAEFVTLIDEQNAGELARRIPFTSYGDAGRGERFDESGHPSGGGWDEVLVPRPGDPQAYALEIDRNDLAPVYRSGEIVVVSPSASIRRGDRVVIRTRQGDLLLRELVRQSAAKLELATVTGGGESDSLDLSEIAWMSRIIWASQ